MRSAGGTGPVVVGQECTREQAGSTARSEGRVVSAKGTGNTPTVWLRPPRHPLDARAPAWWRAHCLLGAGIPLVVLVVLALLLAPARGALLGAAALLAGIGVATAMVLPPWWYRLHRWEVTATAVYVRSGWLRHEWRVAPMSRIQTVDTTSGLLQNAFGLVTVVVTTASAKGALTIAGLDREVAADLTRRLTDASVRSGVDPT